MDDICLQIINFEDLSSQPPPQPAIPPPSQANNRLATRCMFQFYSFYFDSSRCERVSEFPHKKFYREFRGGSNKNTSPVFCMSREISAAHDLSHKEKNIRTQISKFRMKFLNLKEKGSRFLIELSQYVTTSADRIDPRFDSSYCAVKLNDKLGPNICTRYPVRDISCFPHI